MRELIGDASCARARQVGQLLIGERVEQLEVYAIVQQECVGQ
jgi:hypothetical protein